MGSEEIWQVVGEGFGEKKEVKLKHYFNYSGIVSTPDTEKRRTRVLRVM